MVYFDFSVTIPKRRVFQGLGAQFLPQFVPPDSYYEQKKLELEFIILWLRTNNERIKG